MVNLIFQQIVLKFKYQLDFSNTSAEQLSNFYLTPA